MGGLINQIKKFFSGIFSFIGGLFGGKSGYFMEYKDEAESLAEKVKDSAPAKAIASASEKVKDSAPAKAVASASEKVADKAKSAATAVVEATKADEKPESAQSVKKPEPAPAKKPEPVKSVKAAKAKPAKVDAAETNGSAINPSTAGAHAEIKPEVSVDALNLPQPTVSFATEYLTPKPTNSRRRPGANMGSFLEMAKQVKTSNN